MYSNIMRLIMIVLSVLLSIFTFSIGILTFCLLLIVSTLLLISGYFRYGAVFPALRKVKSNDFEGAKKHLKSIREPLFLTRFARAYYYLEMGIIKSNESDLILAEEYLLKSIELKPRWSNDLALANAALAEVYIKKGDKPSATTYLDKAVNLPHASELNLIINNLKAQLTEVIEY